jgi:predicted component of type VI protein secretion system
MAMNETHTYIANHATHAWLRNFEHEKGVQIGERLNSWPIHLRQQIGFGSEPRALLLNRSQSEIPELIWNDFGLFGPSGPLPELFTERILHSSDGKYLLQFIDGLIQRLAHLHYRAWASNRPECDTKKRANGFKSFLKDLSGCSTEQLPHFSWSKPQPNLLPLMAKKRLKVELDIKQSPVQKMRNDNPFSLGRHRLGEVVMGQYLLVYHCASRKFRISIKPRDVKDFEILRDPQSLLRRKIQALIQTCIPNQQSEIHIEPVKPSQSARLGQMKIGRSFISQTSYQLSMHGIEDFKS